MRLIDAEPIEKAIAEWEERETNESLTTTIVDNVGTWITHAPTIEAIPISWLLLKLHEDYVESNLDTIAVIEIGRLIDDWRKENGNN